MALPFRDGEPPRHLMWATWTLIALCLFTYAFLQPKAMQGLTHGLTIEDQSRAELEIRDYVDRHGLVPCEVTHGKSIAAGAACDGYPSDTPDAYAPKNPYVPFLGVLFLHGSFMHLLGNLLFLWLFGRGVEQRLGGSAVLALYLAAGIAASLTYVAWHPESTEPLVGASGAIAGLMGSYLVLLPRRRILAMVYSVGLQFVYLPAWALLGLFFTEQFFVDPAEHVAWEAHVGGMVFGAAVAAVIAWRNPTYRSWHTGRTIDHVTPAVSAPEPLWEPLPTAPPASPPT